MMRRRDVISLLGGAAVAWPMVARAQQQPNRVRNVAWLGVGQAGQPSPYLESLRAGLRELGWVEGRDLKLSTFWPRASTTWWPRCGPRSPPTRT